MNSYTTRLRDDHGVVAVVVAILMIVFLGLAALAVDMGHLYTVKRQLQAAADAAALAGVRELAVGAGEPTVLTVAEEYASRNAEAPAGELTMVDDEPLTEVGADFVRVTVEQPSPLFFGRIVTPGPANIQATAEARIVYVTGMRGLIPVGLPILRATRVYAWLDGAQVGGVWLTKGADGLWSGSLPVPALNADTSRRVNLDVYNEQDFMQRFEDVSIVHAIGATRPYRSVNVSPAAVRNHPGSVEPGSVTVNVVGTGQTTIRLDGVTRTGTGTYSVTLPAPDTTELQSVFDIDLWVGGRDSGRPALDDAAVVNSVRSTHPLGSVELANRFFTPGAAGSTNITVGFTDYEFGEAYHMKLESDPEVGNFSPVTFEGGGASAYRDDLRNGYDGIVSLGQVLDTEPGNMAGPTNQGIRDRLQAGVDFNTWVAQGMPRTSSRLVYVPVTERIEPLAGRSRLRVVSFAAFYLEPQQGHADIIGRFVEYVLPSDVYDDTPPDSGLYLETFRLVTPQTEM